VPALVRRALLSLTACMLLVPAVAHASWQSVIKDCRDGAISQHHSLADYTQALKHLSSDVIEYTDCESLIRRAQLAAAVPTKKDGGGGSGTSSGGGSTPSSGSGGGGSSGASAAPPSSDPLATATPGQRAAVTHAIRQGAEPVRVGQQLLRPASLGASSGVSATSLPTALIVLLVALGLGALGIGVAAVAPRVRARRAS
jgi:hypothetical protein